MSILIGIVLGAAATWLFVRWRSQQDRSPSPDTATSEHPVPALPSPAAQGSEPPLVRLQKMTPALDAVGEASVHPRDLNDHETFRTAVALLRSPDVAIGALNDYALGANWMLSSVAFAALLEREDRDALAGSIVDGFRHVRPWPLHYALQYCITLRERPAAGALLLHCPEWWSQNPIIPGLIGEHLTARAGAGEQIGFGAALQGLQPADIDTTEQLLRKINQPAAAELLNQLAHWRRTSLDRGFLQAFGRFWETDLEQQLLIEHEAIGEQLAIAEACILHAPPRSILAVGDPRTGKSAFLRLLAARATQQGWCVFEAGAANLMAGQEYIGQLEERLRRIAAELSAEKRVLWYVPDMLQLALSGTHRGQAASILDQIFPAIASGKVIVLSETTANGLTTLLQRKPALRSAMEAIRLRALNDSELQTLMSRFAARAGEVLGIQADRETVDSAVHLARYYLGSDQLPGAALDLLKLGLQHAAASGTARLQREHLLAVLSQQTGMPRSVLDDRERVELGTIRAFFAARVIGQPEAVSAVVDRVAMLKAGLTDPSRPVGVFLFAGPTGTGKTELAKALASYLFGAAERLVRLDMSEFQQPDSARKILGDPHEPDAESLTQRVRKQPFAVVLLDEFEKAHPAVWDLFLQVFDDGRLTDASGRTVDFRHTIIILTSNLGATAHQSAGLGFAPAASAFSQDQVLRAVAQSFRPEFVNRLDKVLVFRPLTRDLMRDILGKELQRVLERRGLRHREWAVEWESSALDFLLDKGFSPAMGARPLKRAIDQHVLAPLAALMVEHRFPQGDQFLFVRSDGHAIQVEFVDPDAPSPALAPEATAAAGGPTLPRIALHATGSKEEFVILEEASGKASNLGERADWATLHNELMQQMAGRDFWDRDDRHRVLARYALMDRVKAAAATATRLCDRLARSASRSGMYSRDLAARLATQLLAVEHGILDALSNAPTETVLSVVPALDTPAEMGAQRAWCNRVLQMYRDWAGARRMQVSEVADPASGHPLLVISGFGAHRVLVAEAGLHVLESGPADHERDRVVARVRVAAVPDAAVEANPRTLAGLLDSASAVTTIVRRYRLSPSPLVRDARLGWRTGKADLVLAGHFDLVPHLIET